MPRRRWRPLGRRAAISPTLRTFFETGELPPPDHPEYHEIYFFADVAGLWRQYGAEIVADWARTHGGRKPWAWAQYGPPDV